METTTTVAANDSSLADRLRQWRKEQGNKGKLLPREKAAVRIGVSSSTLKRWEKGGDAGAGGMALLERAGVLTKGDV